LALGAGGKALGRLGVFRAAASFLRSAPRSVTRDLTRDAGQTARRSLRTDLANLRTRARQFVSRTLTKDPIDVATGEVVLAQTDVELAGMLPLVLARTHVSSYRSGTLFGPSWASTLDQRLEVDSSGMTLASADGMVLAYPTPASDDAVWPIEGPRRPLSPEAGGGYAVADPQTGHVHHFASLDGTRARTLPLTAVTDRNGNRIDFHYDDEAVLTEVRHSGGYRIAVDVVDGRVRALRLVTGPGDAPAVELARYAYDGAGHLAEVVDSSGEPLRFSYDAAGRLTGWIDRNGSWYRYSYDERGRAVTGDGADGFLNTRLTYDPDGRFTTVTDSLGHVTTYRLNELRQVVAEVDPLGHRTTSEWDRYDRLLSRTDPRGHTTRYRYDAAGNVIEIRRADGRRITGRYNALNLPVTVVGADEETTWRQEYDTRGNLIAVTDPAGGITRRTYDDRGSLTAISDALGATTHVVTNPAGLPVRITDPAGAEVRYERDFFGRVTAMTDPAGGVARYGWTVDGRPAWRTAPGGAIERWTYDGEGNPTTHVDTAGQVTRTEYTHFDLPATRTGPDGARLEFGYDTEARLVSVTTSQGLVWRYEYDAAGNLARETDFNGRRVTYAHDAGGRLISRVDGAGQTTHFTRDPLDRVTAQVTGGKVTAFSYDPAGNLMRAANPDADVVFQRDRLGRVTAETCNGATVHTAYDALGRRVLRRTPTGAESHWAYDAAGRPVGLRTAGEELRFGYDPAGREIERRIGSGVVLAQEWDPLHRLTSQALWGAPGADAPPAPGTEGPAAHASGPRLLQHRTYGYRADGHVTAIGDRLAGSRTFDLDRAGRVTAVSADGWAERYAYDDAGNVTHAVWPAPPDEEASGEDSVGERDYSGTLLRRAGRVHYEHDVQGRVVLRRRRTLSGKVLTWTYTWDVGDRLSSVTTPDGRRWHYRYDPLGRRVTKERVGPEGVIEQTDFHWDGLLLVEETHTDWQRTGPVRRTLTWNHRPGTFQPLTQTERAPGASQDWVDQRFHAIITDLVGAPAELVDAGGGVVRQPRRSLWGAGLASDTTPSSCPLRFPGQYHDSESGLDYNYRRYYDPAGGRYQSGDPLGLTPQPNPHAYVHNPTVSADPLGLAPYPLENNRSMWQQKIEAKAAADRGLSPVTLHEGAGMEGLTGALRGESEFKWAVVAGEGGARELRVMPANYGANGWPRTEMAHTVLAGPGGKVYAAGSGSAMEGFPAFINRASGHFEPGEETLPIGTAAFDKAGIDVIASNTY
jgi:RHS repeat-associated protein